MNLSHAFTVGVALFATTVIFAEEQARKLQTF